MSVKYSRMIALAIAIPCVFVQAFAASTNSKPVHKHLVAKQLPPPAPEPAVPVIPLQPLNLDQMPASPPQVSFNNGQLAIVAPNSTLGEILRAVKAQTGAVIEMPGNPSDRVVGHMGPGPARDVLAALLNGTRFNYVLLGSATNPDGLAHIILIPKSGGEPVQQANAQPPQAVAGAPQPGTPLGGPQVQPAENDDEDDAGAADQQNPPEDQGEGDQNQQNQAKSPEQLLQELQRQQQVQQQLGQQPGGPGGPRFPGLPQQPPAQQPEQ
jgi:hypothetical protein